MKSLKYKIIIQTLVIIVLVEVIYGFITYNATKTKSNDTYQKLGVVISNNFIKNIAFPLYDLNEEGINNVIKNTLDFSQVAAIVIKEKDDNKVVRKNKLDASGAVVEFDGNDKDLELKKEAIVYNNETIAYLYLYMTDKEMKDALSSMRNSLILTIILIVLILGAGLWFSVEKVIIKPIKAVVLKLKDISEGEGDLTAKIEVKEMNEIGELSTNFNIFLEKIRDIVVKVKENSKTVQEISTHIKTLSDNTAANLNEQFSEVEITSANAMQISSSAENIAGAVLSQSAAVTETNSALENITDNAKTLSGKGLDMQKFVDTTAEMIKQTVESVTEINKSVDNNNQGLELVIGNLNVLNDGVSQVGAAIEETTVSINEISSNLEKAAGLTNDTESASGRGKQVVEKTIVAMNDIASKVNDIGTVIARLKSSSNQIGDIVGVIDAIAEQTNLLALNAAIEAARAGEAGKGFAVVADEIRKLAEKTSKSTKQIEDTVKSIQNDTNIAVTSMDRGKKEVDNGVGLVADAGKALIMISDKINDLASLIKTINISSREQSKAAAIISNQVVDMNRSSNESVAEAKRQANESKSLLKLAGKVTQRATSIDVATMRKSVDDVAGLIKYMANSLDEISYSMQDIDKQSLDIKNHSEKQTAGTHAISLSVKKVIEKNMNSLDKSKSLLEKANDLDQKAKDLGLLISKFKT